MKTHSNDIEKLDRCHFHFDPAWKTETDRVNGRMLLSRNRFDLYAILIYIDQKVKGVTNLKYALNVYKQRTCVMTGFSYKEAGNDNKTSFEDFLTVLDNLIVSFQKGAFDSESSLVPVDRNYVLMDGAHRVCCAAYFNQDIKILRFIDKDFNQCVTSSFLCERTLPLSVADAMALEYCRWHENIFMLFLWPKTFVSAEDKQKADRLIADTVNVVYRKTQQMSFSGIRNLMIQVYSKMDWIGNIDNDFYNTYVKANEVWHKNGHVEFILVEAPSCESILNLKQKVRDIFQMDLASIHSTDIYEETLIAAQLIYNPNSMHHLNIGYPTKFKSTHYLIEKFKDLIANQNLDINKFIVDSSMVMSVYGIREAADLDYSTTLSETSLITVQDKIENHKDSIRYYYMSCTDLIENPANYFIYSGVKFVSLQNLILFKNNRRKSRDINDIRLTNAYIDINKNRMKFILYTLKNEFHRKEIIYKKNLRTCVHNALKRMYLFGICQSIYHKLKR